jgi:hypothetical protein
MYPVDLVMACYNNLPGWNRNDSKQCIHLSFLQPYPCRAAAPLTISVSSVVMAAWRARL